MEQKDEPIKFHRPPNNDNFKQSKVEKDMMAYKVLFGYPNNAVYAFFHPEYVGKDGKLNKAGAENCRQYFTHPGNIAYMDALRAHLSSLMKGARVMATDNIDTARKDKVLKQLLSQAMSLVESGEGLDPDTMKTVVEVFRKLNILKDETEQVESPRRYLPCRCGECNYRSFVESYVETGQIENSCLRCKALDIAKEHGFCYDPKNLLRPTDEKTAE